MHLACQQESVMSTSIATVVVNAAPGIAQKIFAHKLALCLGAVATVGVSTGVVVKKHPHAVGKVIRHIADKIDSTPSKKHHPVPRATVDCSPLLGGFGGSAPAPESWKLGKTILPSPASNALLGEPIGSLYPTAPTSGTGFFPLPIFGGGIGGGGYFPGGGGSSSGGGTGGGTSGGGSGGGGGVTPPPSTSGAPEPGEWALLAIGLGSVGALMRLKKNKKINGAA
jgi:hypothetical protein